MSVSKTTTETKTKTKTTKIPIDRQQLKKQKHPQKIYMYVYTNTFGVGKKDHYISSMNILLSFIHYINIYHGSFKLLFNILLVLSMNKIFNI